LCEAGTNFALSKNSNLLPICHSFIELKSVDSTNNYAMAKVHAGTASEGTIFFAHEQWAGKGQRGKSWNSLPGENIIMSVVLEPVFLSVTRQFPLSACVALACHDLFSRYVPPGEAFIKWPNDLYWNDRKAGGILIENSFRGDKWVASIVGIGININQEQFPGTLPNPISLRQITGRSYDAVKMARELGDCLWLRYEQLRSPDAGSLLAEYNTRLYKLGQTITLRWNDAILQTMVKKVGDGGELLTEDVTERQFRFGEVEWIIP
jgi:BirA family biotin operon repressor/biotin-[acetyl-CoA-carboxylase] ligase